MVVGHFSYSQTWMSQPFIFNDCLQKLLTDKWPLLVWRSSTVKRFIVSRAHAQSHSHKWLLPGTTWLAWKTGRQARTEPVTFQPTAAPQLPPKCAWLSSRFNHLAWFSRRECRQMTDGAFHAKFIFWAFSCFRMFEPQWKAVFLIRCENTLWRRPVKTRPSRKSLRSQHRPPG